MRGRPTLRWLGCAGISRTVCRPEGQPAQSDLWASGGVGTYAVQIAKALGAHVTGLSGPDSQTLVSSLGADVTLNYKTTKLSDIVDRFDVILDTVGVVAPRQARKLLRREAFFLPLNIGLREFVAALLNPFFDRKVRLAVNPNTPKDLEHLAGLVRNGKVQPIIDTVYPLSEASAAHAHVETRHRKGAIVLSVLDKGSHCNDGCFDDGHVTATLCA
ncbi:MAG: zinc-binding dehydrogenase [Pseudomonadota bacterium]